MEALTIFIIVIIVTIILFSSFTVSYSNDTPIASTKNNKASSKLNRKPGSQIYTKGIDIGKHNPKATSYALYNLPEKDQYMTPDLKNQIDFLRTQYYYDNCAKTSFQQ